MLDTELRIIEHKLDTAATFTEVFGEKPEIPDIKRIFHVLAKVLHPDMVPDDLKTDATRVFEKLVLCRNDAMKALDEGTYNQGRKKFELVSITGTYSLEEVPYAKGEHSIIYRGTHRINKILAKVAATPPDNSFLEDEANLLSSEKNPKAFAFVPKIIDTFHIDQGDKRYRVNIMPLPEGFVTLRQICEAFPNGLDPKDVSWIFRRVLGASLTASSLKMTHTAITLDHILVHPIKHDPLYLGWGHTARRGARRDWRVDVFAAAEIFLELANNYPAEIGVILNKCLLKDESDRPPVDWVMKEFTAVVRRLWGTEYRPLTMPT